MAITTMIGAKIHRREDPRLVSGEGRFIDDHVRPGTVFLSVVRSPHAHALIKSIDLGAAKGAPGVVAVYTHGDFAKVVAGTMPAAPAFVAEKKQVPPRFPIAEKEVAYQGEPVAVVLAETRYQAADAGSLVDVDYEPLPAVMDLEKALEAKSPKAHTGAPDNLELGSETQVWLAVSPDQGARVSGAYFHHRRRDPHPAARDTALQDALLVACEQLTGTPMRGAA